MFQMSLLLHQSLISTYMNYGRAAHRVATAISPRMGAALPQLPQLSASSRPPVLVGWLEIRYEEGEQKRRLASRRQSEKRIKDAAALLVW
jgi:hypothetical protein